MLIFGQIENESIGNYAYLTTYVGDHLALSEERSIMDFSTVTVPANSTNNVLSRITLRGDSAYVIITGIRRTLSSKVQTMVSLDGSKHVYGFGDEPGMLTITCQMPKFPARIVTNHLVSYAIPIGDNYPGFEKMFQLFKYNSLGAIIDSGDVSGFKDRMIKISYNIVNNDLSYVTYKEAPEYMQGWLLGVELIDEDIEYGMITANLRILPKYA